MLRLHLLLPLLLALGCINAIQNYRVKRAAPDFNVKLWNKDEPIPYILDGRFNINQAQRIYDAIQSIMDNTCINFVEDTTTTGLKVEYFLEDDATVCKSPVGDIREQNKKNQRISLGRTCLNSGTILHETMHTLGFQHTQKRPDRDEYVNVVPMDEIPDELKIAYQKLELTDDTTDYGIPYEYNSIMHYDTGIYMKPKDDDYLTIVGGKRMLFNDWKIINFRYKCNETCTDKITCQNGGYQHPRHCDMCVCPRFYTGPKCDQEPEVVTLKVDEPMPLYEGWPLDREVYDAAQVNDLEKYQRSKPRIIKAPEGTRILVTIVNITDFMQPQEQGKCQWKALEIVDGDLTSVGKQFCYFVMNGNHSFYSKTNVVGHLVYSIPGLDFETNVTFTAEKLPDNENSMTTETKTEEPNPPQIEEQSITPGKSIGNPPTEGLVNEESVPEEA